ncbi:hypothetical protein BKA70DRAFT_1433096 [Coprinopsis sp. MPI-PUGE-AT-0042]|nr:hypothetical protein BKA70DRAFT_1433096 [Coprinopsis sp. MPI-PUGE-AT-0042]
MDSSRLDNLEDDLADVPTVAFPTMLKAWLMRLASLGQMNLPEPPCGQRKHKVQTLHEFKGHAERNMRTIQENAVQFCNGTTPHAVQVKEAFNNGLLEPNLHQRLESIVKGLNAVLLAYSGKQLGDLPHTPCQHDLIFVVNKCKAATGGDGLLIAGTTLQSLAHLSRPYRRKSLEQWTKTLETKTWKLRNPTCHLPWENIWNSWDVTSTESLALVEFPSFAAPDTLRQGQLPSDYLTRGSSHRPTAAVMSHSGSDSLSPASTPAAGKRKHRSDQSVSPSPKRRKTDRASDAVDLESEVQYESACNGLQMLCSRWDRTHSFSLVLQDNFLSLRWYDAQGCIATEPIDIIAQLPLLVATVVLFQRFSPRMRGSASLDLAVPLGSRSMPFDVRARPHWQLKGRHGVFGTPVPRGSYPQVSMKTSARTTRSRAKVEAEASSLADLFFKLSWRDERRLSEALVIAVAKERAKHYIPNPDHVIDHLPEVVMHEEHDELSTRHIRESLGLETVGSRVPSIMVMRKLQQLDTLDPEDFQDYIWQIIRCLRLLWGIGVAHQDLSFWNMMHTGASDATRTAVLIDFDHATIMEPGSLTPALPDTERVGTRPFIAMTMGYKAEQPIQRLFRHDLESVLWCMVWYCQEQPKWLEGTYLEVCGQKNTWFYRMDSSTLPTGIRKGSEALWKPIVDATTAWMTADYMSLQPPQNDREWLEIINSHFDCPPRLGDDWMTFQVPRHKIRRKDRSKAR